MDYRSSSNAYSLYCTFFTLMLSIIRSLVISSFRHLIYFLTLFSFSYLRVISWPIVSILEHHFIRLTFSFAHFIIHQFSVPSITQLNLLYVRRFVSYYTGTAHSTKLNTIPLSFFFNPSLSCCIHLEEFGLFFLC
jgi:hypothetical protein